MSVKKNLTVATLAALLAVPTFNTIASANTNITLRKPVTAKVEHEVIPAYHDKYVGYHTFPAGDHVNVNYAGTNGIGLNINDSHNGTNVSNYADTVPGTSPASEKTFAEEYGTQNNEPSQTNESNSNSTTGTQYASKNSLPQTGENDGASKAMAAGAVALSASASLMALSIAKKRKQDADLETVTPDEPAVDNGDGKDNTESNADKSVYNMIMGDTFKSISKDLKQM